MSYNSEVPLVLGSLLVGSIITNVVWFFIIKRLKAKRAAAPLPLASVTLEDWSVLATGSSGWIEIERAWLRTVQKLFEIFCVKQHDYGPTNIGLGKREGIIIRMGDKMSRLWNLGLNGKEAAVNSEALEDTLLDLADYGIIGTLVLAGEWPLYEAEQVWSQSRKVS